MPNVRIVQLDQPTLEALAAGDLARAGRTSPVPLSDWLASEECRATWAMRARQVAEAPRDAAWVTGVVVDTDTGDPVGRAGFHSAPDRDGTVEVGYAVDPALRRRGYASAVLAAMVDRARADPAVRTLVASVSPGNAASLATLAPYAFVETGEQWDEEDGLETVYELDVSGSVTPSST